MAEQPFPWNRARAVEPADDDASTDSVAHASHSTDAARRPLKRMLGSKGARAAAPFAAFAILLIFIYWSRGHAAPAAAAAEPDIDALVVMLPIPKGNPVPSEILKQIPLLRQDLTKGQALQLIRPADLERLHGRIRAKKNLPPNKPLLWSDIEFRAAPTGAPATPATAIVFSKEN